MAMTRTEIQAKYDAKTAKHYSLKFNVNTDSDIIEKLSNVGSVQAYIKQLIREDIQKQEQTTKTDE